MGNKIQSKGLFSKIKKNSKAQVSMEFMISIIIVLAVFVVGMGIMQDRFNYNVSSSNKSNAELTAYRFARSINSVYLLDDGACLSDTIFWEGYGKSISFGERSVDVYFSGGFFGANVVTKNVSWNISDINGVIYFHKTNGYIDINYDGGSC